MDWDDLEAILFEGDADEIAKACCPDCQGNISFEYSETAFTFLVTCPYCKKWSKWCKAYHKPNCAIFFGNKTTLGKETTDS